MHACRACPGMYTQSGWLEHGVGHDHTLDLLAVSDEDAVEGMLPCYVAADHKRLVGQHSFKTFPLSVEINVCQSCIVRILCWKTDVWV